VFIRLLVPGLLDSLACTVTLLDRAFARVDPIQEESSLDLQVMDITMSNPSREFQFGQQLYQVRVSKAVDRHETLYVRADTITVDRSGALILAATATPVELEEDDPDEGIQLPPGLIVAPGHWHSAVHVTTDRTHLPMFFEGGYFDQTLGGK
jgi:hypothetical protein